MVFWKRHWCGSRAGRKQSNCRDVYLESDRFRESWTWGRESATPQRWLKSENWPCSVFPQALTSGPTLREVAVVCDCKASAAQFVDAILSCQATKSKFLSFRLVMPSGLRLRSAILWANVSKTSFVQRIFLANWPGRCDGVTDLRLRVVWGWTPKKNDQNISAQSGWIGVGLWAVIPRVLDDCRVWLSPNVKGICGDSGCQSSEGSWFSRIWFRLWFTVFLDDPFGIVNWRVFRENFRVKKFTKDNFGFPKCLSGYAMRCFRSTGRTYSREDCKALASIVGSGHDLSCPLQTSSPL